MPKMNYSFFNEVLLRVPFFSFNDRLYEDKFEETMDSPYFKEALYNASPSLYRKYLDLSVIKRKDKKEYYKIKSILYKYYLRSYSRNIPFGLFSGCTIGSWNEDASDNFQFNEKHGRRTFLDYHFLYKISDFLLNSSFINEVIVFPNNTIYVKDNYYRYIETYEKKNDLNFATSKIQVDEVLEHILLKCAGQGIKFENLLNNLIENGIDQEEADSYLKDLIKNDFLTTSIKASLLNTHYQDKLKIELKKYKKDDDIDLLKNNLDFTFNELDRFDKNVINNVSDYQNIIDRFKLFDNNIDGNNFFHIELTLEISNFKLDASIQKKLLKGITILNKFSSYPPINPDLEEFKTKFISSYQDSEIPLLELIDGDVGISYAINTAATLDNNPLIQGVNSNHKNDIKVSLDKITEIKLQLLTEANRNNLYSIELKDELISSLQEVWDDLSSTFYCMFNVLDKKKEKIEIIGVGGESASNLVTRYHNTVSNCEEFVTKIQDKEKYLNPDFIVAEVVALSDKRGGNVMGRTVNYDYIININSNNDELSVKQIPLNDLYVSVIDNRVFLRSKRLNKFILPRVSSAHNYYYKSFPLYKFLGELQSQGIRKSLSFNWGNLSQYFKVLPEVRYGNLILSKATWNLNSDDLDVIKNDRGISKIRSKYNIPRHILIVDGDNELLIDLENKLSQEIFIDEFKKNKSIIIKEFIYDKGGNIVSKKSNSYVNSFVAFLHKNDPIVTPNINYLDKISLLDDKNSIKMLGSEWIYFRLYGGTKFLEKFLISDFNKLMDYFKKKSLINSWFFIRYYDSDNHLRFRIKLNDLSERGKVIDDLYQLINPLIENRTIYDVIFDTYKKEYYRYGGGDIGLFENLFYIDSIFTIKLLEKNLTLNDGHMRWKYAIKLIDKTLEVFRYSIEGKSSLLELMSNAYVNEFNLYKPDTLALDKKYRYYTDTINKVFQENNDSLDIDNILEEYFSHPSLIENISGIKSKNYSINYLNELVISLIHMSINRIFLLNQRKTELVIYYYLSKYYKSQVARLKYNKHE